VLEIGLLDVVSFVRQASAAIAGAAALFSLFFFSGGKKQLFRAIDQNIVVASVVYIAAWVVGWMLRAPAVAAHVGVSLTPAIDDFTRGYIVQWPLVIVLAILVLTSRRGFARLPQAYNLSFFIIMSLLISTYGVAATFGRQELSYILHGWHSILTLGTVVVLDYLFFVSRNDRKQLAMLTESFSLFTVFIFIGLGLDWLSTYFILPGALDTSQRFFFVQTLIVIIIINGVLLSGPLTRAASKYLSVKKQLPPRLQMGLGLMGVISLVSWVTITFLDFVQDIGLSYWQLGAIYLALIAAGFITHLVIDGWPFGTKKLLRSR